MVNTAFSDASRYDRAVLIGTSSRKLLAALAQLPDAMPRAVLTSQRSVMEAMQASGQPCTLLDERLPRRSGSSYSELISYVTDRPGHDFRYAVCSDKAERDLEWERVFTFESGLVQTVDWYLENLDWCEDIRSDRYTGQRLGAASVTRLAS